MILCLTGSPVNVRIRPPPKSRTSAMDWIFPEELTSASCATNIDESFAVYMAMNNTTKVPQSDDMALPMFVRGSLGPLGGLGSPPLKRSNPSQAS